MPAVHLDDYIPRAGEPAMMTAEQREKAQRHYYRELAEKGEGRLITFGDGTSWWVPRDLTAIAQDVERVLTGKTGGLPGFVIGEALQLVVEIAREGVNAAPQSAPASDDSVGSLVKSVAALGRAIEHQSQQIAKLSDVAKPVEPAIPQQGVSETICARLEDAGFTNVDFNRPGVSRGATPFVNLVNGVKLKDGEPVIGLPTPQQAIEATMEGIHALADEAQTKRLIWRSFPGLRSESGGYVVRCRLLAMAEKVA